MKRVAFLSIKIGYFVSTNVFIYNDLQKAQNIFACK